ncbi:MAG: hypothetical protein ACRECE_09200, partial [Xanthobacteraceae bacterium]
MSRSRQGAGRNEANAQRVGIGDEMSSPDDLRNGPAGDLISPVPGNAYRPEEMPAYAALDL